MTGLRRTGAEDGLSTYARNTRRSVWDFKSVPLSDGSQTAGFTFVAASKPTHPVRNAARIPLDPPVVVWPSLTLRTGQRRSGHPRLFQRPRYCGNFICNDFSENAVGVVFNTSIRFQMGELITESDAFECLASRLNADVLLDTKLMEAMKLHVLSAALSLELADNLGDALPLFALALFSRPDSKNVKNLALNYLNPIGDSTTLERVIFS